MKKQVILIILLLLTNYIYAQFNLKVTTNRGTDTLHICQDTVVKFIAITTYGTDTLNNVKYYWDFDNNYSLSGINEDTIEYHYTKGKGYRVRVAAAKDADSAYVIIPIEVSITPNFHGTKSGLPENQTGICKGDEISLIGKASDTSWKSTLYEEYIEKIPQLIDNEHIYLNSPIDQKAFPQIQTINSPSDIDSVGIIIEHSNLSDLKISLICPNGNSVVLKDFGGPDKYLGLPVDNENSMAIGTGTNYFWTNSPSFGTINSASTLEISLPSGTYTSEQPFGNLIGCPLNGKWTMQVEDNQSGDNGYIFSWSLKTNKDIEPEPWTYVSKYNIANSIWKGNYNDVSATSLGIAIANPTTEGNIGYEFRVRDTWNCRQDTTITINVEGINFTVEPLEADIGDSISCTDETSWAKYWEWNFGDKTDNSTQQNINHVYENKGEYSIILISTSETGCKDTDTVKVKINPIPIELPELNAFVPNGDGKNDIFTFFSEKQQSPNGKGNMLKVARNIKTLDGRIFNRYGDILCKWNSVNEAIEGWDGTINNKGRIEAVSGIYYYILLVEGKDGSKKKFSGFFYLFR